MPHISQLKFRMQKIPFQIWVIYASSFIFSVGSSMAWPYLNIFLQQKLSLPLSTTTLLISLRAVTGILASFVAGSISDRFGRRGVILVSLLTGSVYYFLMAHAGALWQFALLMGVWGALDLFFPVGSNAMIADLVPIEDRLSAFSLMRMMHNAGISIGPIIGGVLAARSYEMIFYSAAVGYLISFVMTAFTVRETLDRSKQPEITEDRTKIGFAQIFKDNVFISTIVMGIFVFMGSSIVFNLLSLYARETHGIAESRISIVFTVNAVMCVFLQLPVMRLTEKYHPLLVMIVAAVLYAIGLSSFGLILWYCVCMAVLTVGELMITPTMLAITAKRAPAEARGRYLSIYNLAHPVGYAFGPALAGNFYERLFPDSIWLSAGFYCVIAAIGFFVLYKRNKDAGWLRKLSVEG